eukprot:scaffold11910_cov106-Isochrysis_galbana.AAC.3
MAAATPANDCTLVGLPAACARVANIRRASSCWLRAPVTSGGSRIPLFLLVVSSASRFLWFPQVSHLAPACVQWGVSARCTRTRVARSLAS